MGTVPYGGEAANRVARGRDSCGQALDAYPMTPSRSAK